jgi:hypothetical protein
LTSLNDKIKLIPKGSNVPLEQNRVDIGTTRNTIKLEYTVKNVSEDLINNLNIILPVGIDRLEPKKIPDSLVPKQTFRLVIIIDTSISKSLTAEFEGSFTNVVQR